MTEETLKLIKKLFIAANNHSLVHIGECIDAECTDEEGEITVFPTPENMLASITAYLEETL